MKRSEMPDSLFGIPSQRKYRLDTKEHTLSAIKLFNFVEDKYEKELAGNILSAIKRFNITDGDINMTEKNRFYKYYHGEISLESVQGKDPKTMTVDELKAEVERLSHNDVPEVRNFGEVVLGFLRDGSYTVSNVISAITSIIFVGETVLALCIGAIIGTIYILGAMVPFLTIQSLLKVQMNAVDKLPSNQKKSKHTKRYIQTVKRYLKVKTKEDAKALSESIFIGDSLSNLIVVLEAPKEEDEEDALDYTDDGTDDDDMIDYTEAEDEVTTDDSSNDDADPEAIDYTDNDDSSDLDEPTDYTDTGDDGTSDESGETDTGDSESNIDDMNDTSSTDTDSSDLDEPTDYTDTGDDGTSDESGETGTDDSESNIDDTGSTDGDSTQDKNIIVKNYNLLRDFKSMYQAIDEILSNLEPVIFNRSIQNSVMEQVIKNMTKLKDAVMDYIEFHFNTDYTINLYYYSIFVQAMKINLEILHKNDQLGKDNETNN